MRFRLVPAENPPQGADSWSLQNQTQVESTAVYKVNAKSTKLMLKLYPLPCPLLPQPFGLLCVHSKRIRERQERDGSLVAGSDTASPSPHPYTCHPYWP